MSPRLRIPPVAVRPVLRLLGRSAFDPGAPWARQRKILGLVGHVTRVRRDTEITPTRAGGVPVERLVAPGASTGRVVIHFHGGGYTVGGPAICRAWASGISAEAGVTVLLPDYRLAPEAPAPAAADDARSVWDEVADAVGADAVVVSGDSAGAGIALALTQALQSEGQTCPAGLILISPWLDLDAWKDPAREGWPSRDCLLTPAWLGACVAAYASGLDPASPNLSPLFGELGKLPPVLVQTAAYDLLISDADRFVTRAREAGTEVTYARAPGLWHDFPLQAGIVAAADKAVTQAATFVTGCCARRP